MWQALATIPDLVSMPGFYSFCSTPLLAAFAPISPVLLWPSAMRPLTSWDVCCSVLIHLLPGLALFAHRHFSPPACIAHIKLLNQIVHGRDSLGSASFWWFLVAPTIFYAAWQTIYWFIVQVSPPSPFVCILLSSAGCCDALQVCACLKNACSQIAILLVGKALLSLRAFH